MLALPSCACVIAGALVLCAELRGSSATPAQKPKKDGAQAAISRELAELYRSDQKDQDDESWNEANGDEFSRRQKVRRDRAMEIVSAGQLATVEDWNHASMLFQHGQSPEDYLLAHVLSVPPAVGKLALSGFMCAATLDRYLQHIGRAQIFSTQLGGADPATAPLIEPFDESMPDTIRAVFGLDARKRGDGADRKRGAKTPSAKDLPKLLTAARASAKSEAASDASPEWLARAKDIVAAGALQKEQEYFTAAQILACSKDADDLRDAHVLAIAAALLGHEPAMPLCAETLDRFVVAVGRPAPLGTIPKSADDRADASTRSTLHRVILERYGLVAPQRPQAR